MLYFLERKGGDGQKKESKTMGSTKNESGERRAKWKGGRKGEKEHGHATQLKEERKMGKG